MAPYLHPSDFPLGRPCFLLPLSRYGVVQLTPGAWYVARRATIRSFGKVYLSEAWIALPTRYASEMEASLAASLALVEEDKK